MQLLHIHPNSNNALLTWRRESLGGKDYIVAQGVPLVEGVLNGRFVSAEQFGAFVNDWNGVPVVMRHPKQNGGSARVPEPDVPIIGRFYGAKLDGARLTGEYWLEADKLAGPEGEMILSRLSTQQPSETSTGYWAESIPSVGNWNGRDFAFVDQNIHPDHIALLPDEVGACSLKDGCGMNRNAQGEEGKWVTIKGRHVLVDKNGNPVTPMPGGKGKGGGESPLNGARFDNVDLEWKSEDTITGSVVIATDNPEAVTESDLDSFLRDHPTELADHIDSSKDIEEIKFSGINRGKDYIEFNVDITPTQEAGDRWLDSEDASGQWSTYHNVLRNVTGLTGRAAKLWEDVYQSYIDKDESEERAAKAAWAAVKGAYEKKNGEWVKKNQKDHEVLGITPQELEGLASLAALVAD